VVQYGEAWQARIGTARSGEVRPGVGRYDMVRYGGAWQAGHGAARRGQARQGSGNNILNSVINLGDTNSGGFVTESLRLAFPSTIPPEERFVVAFTAYFDESGTHEGSEAVVVAGYISTPDLWQNFEAKWREVLAEFGIAFFHMADFAAKKQQFDGWPEDKRRACLSKLIHVVNDHVIASIGTVIPVKEYKDTFSEKANTFVGGPYGVAAWACMISLSGMLDLIGVPGQIAYVFESGAPGYGQVLKVFRWNEQSPGDKEQMRLLSLSFQNKREFCPLQAADILAYELYKYLPESGQPTRYGIKALTDSPRDWGYMDIAELEKWARILEIRVGMKESELVSTAISSSTSQPAVLISIDELRERWHWWRAFNGQVSPKGQRK